MGYSHVSRRFAAGVDGWANAGHAPGALPRDAMRRVRLVSMFLCISVVIDLIVIPHALGQARVLNVALFLVVLPFLVFIRRLLRRGAIDVACHLFAWVVALLIVVAMWHSGGPDSGAIAWVSICFFLFALLLPLRAAVVSIAGTLLCVGILVMLAHHGLAPKVARQPSDTWLDALGPMLCLLFLTTVFLRQQRAAEEELFASVDQLRSEVERRRLAEHDARAAEKLKANFLATISHEIRTPLNGVVGMAEVLARTNLDAPQREMVGTMTRSGEVLLRILNDTLDVSRIQAGGMRLVQRPFSPRRCAEDVVEMMRRDPRANDVTVVLQVAADTPESMLGDADRVRQILFNLAGNALKFTPGGEVRVALSAGPSEGLRLTVSDTGVGMEGAQLARLFEPFAPGDPPRGGPGAGTGLGLAIVRGLAEAMGGRVVCTSAPGEGTTFVVDLALPQTQAPLEADGQPATRLGAQRLQVAGGPHVLIVEDHPTNALVTGMMLQALGCTYVHQSGGAAGLAQAVRERFDLILMDVRMPDQNGDEVTRILRQRGYTGSIIGVTANAMPEDRERCLACGMNDYLPKPLQLDTLEAAIVRHCLPAATSPANAVNS
jgi:signal transduction histidine kinase/ActR/RegA family two-component response regulator